MNDLYLLLSDLDTTQMPLDDVTLARIRRRVRAETRPRSRRSLRTIAILAAAIMAFSICGYAVVTGQFSRWFWNLSADVEAPEQSETLFESFGTVIGQTQTVDGITVTLDGALWDGEYLFLSLTVDGLSREKHYGTADLGGEGSWLSGSKESAMAALRSYYADRPEMEEELETLWQETLPFKKPELLYLYHRSTNTYTLQVSGKHTTTAETGELTLHLENLDFWGETVSGPFTFTFDLAPKDVSLAYSGETVVESETAGALRVSGVRIAPFKMEVDFTTLQPLPQEALETLGDSLVRLADGEEVGASSGQGLHEAVDERGLCHYTLHKAPFHRVLDPRTVTAISLGDTWLELDTLTRN